MQLEYFSLNVEHNLIRVTNEFMEILTLKVKITNFEPSHFLKECPIIRGIVVQWKMIDGHPTACYFC